jgi:L-alanine-DL-glutamate epimerase-like enolase superfamily enzyme
MQITRISLYLTEIPYRNAYKTATNTTKNGRHILCKIETDSGITGWGETGIISQRYPSQGDSPEAMFAVLQHYLAPAIIGMDPTAIETVIWALERVLKGNYFAKTAIDHAIYDIPARHLVCRLQNSLEVCIEVLLP